MRPVIKNIHIALLPVFLLLFGACSGPTERDYISSYEKSDKYTYGTKYTFSLLEDIFDSINVTRNPIENNFSYDYNSGFDTTWIHNYLFITGHFDLEGSDLEYLLSHIYEGNDVFIAASSFELDIMDSLNFQMTFDDVVDSLSSDYGILEDQKVSMSLINNDGTQLQFSFKSYVQPSYFEVSPEHYTTLSTLENGKPNVIKTYYGDGSLILCSTPTMFTNYGILHNHNNVFASCILSQLPKDVPLTWDEFYKPFLTYDRDQQFDDHQTSRETPETRTDFDFILRQPALSWAFWLTLGTFAIYLIIGGKRKQRIIPPVHQKLNSSKEFADIISQLYLQRSDHSDAAHKLINYFLEYIRTAFYTKSVQLRDRAFIAKISARSGLSEEEVESTFSLIAESRQNKNFSQQELLDLNQKLEEFKSKSLV